MPGQGPLDCVTQAGREVASDVPVEAVVLAIYLRH